MASFFPLIGSWYKDTDTNQRFEVVALDEKQKTIEVQYFDGDISEFDIASWGALSITEIQTPEEAYGGYDGLSSFGEETGFSDSFNQISPIDMIEPDSFSGFDDLF